MEGCILNCLIVLLTACSSLASELPNQEPSSSASPVVTFPPYVFDVPNLPDYTDLLQLQGIVKDGFTINAISHMTATVYPNGLDESCSEDGVHNVEGSIDCLTEYYEFQTFQPTLTYEAFKDPVAEKENCYDYTVGFKQCYVAPSTSVDLLACDEPSTMVDNDKSTVWAREINPYKDTIIKLDLNGRYRVVALTLMVETIPLKVSVTLKRRDAAPKTVVTLQQDLCGPNDQTCRQYDRVFRNQLTLSWEVDPQWQIAEEVEIVFWSLHSLNYNGVYSTNYHIIRDIKLLAKPAGDQPAARIDRPRQVERRRQYEKPDVPAPRPQPTTQQTTVTTLMPKHHLIRLLRDAAKRNLERDRKKRPKYSGYY